MLTESEKVNFDRYNRMAYKLNHDAYLMQIKGKNKLSHFIPCDKALVFTGAMAKRPVPVTMQVVPLAALTNCTCHRLGEKELWEIFDTLAKRETEQESE